MQLLLRQVVAAVVTDQQRLLQAVDVVGVEVVESGTGLGHEADDADRDRLA